MNQKVEESRLRRVADRQGYRLIKTRRRDPNAFDYGLYALIDPQHGGTIHPHFVNSPYALTLDEVREYLNQPTHD